MKKLVLGLAALSVLGAAVVAAAAPIPINVKILPFASVEYSALDAFNLTINSLGPETFSNVVPFTVTTSTTTTVTIAQDWSLPPGVVLWTGQEVPSYEGAQWEAVTFAPNTWINYRPLDSTTDYTETELRTLLGTQFSKSTKNEFSPDFTGKQWFYTKNNVSPQLMTMDILKSGKYAFSLCLTAQLLHAGIKVMPAGDYTGRLTITAAVPAVI